VERCGLDASGLGYGSVVDCCEHIEPSDSMKVRKSVEGFMSLVFLCVEILAGTLENCQT